MFDWVYILLVIKKIMFFILIHAEIQYLEIQLFPDAILALYASVLFSKLCLFN